MNDSHPWSNVRRSTRALVVIALAVAVLSGPLARTAGAQSSNLLDVLCSGPGRIAQNCILGTAGINQIEKQAMTDLLRAHHLPSDHAARLLVWERPLIRSLMFDKLLTVINKAPASRNSAEQALVDKVAGLVRDRRLAAANHSRAEYNEWDRDPCGYRAPFGFEWSGWEANCNRLGTLFSGDIPPSLQEFQSYGVAHLAQAWQTDTALQAVSALTSKDLGLVAGFGSVAGGALIASIIGGTSTVGSPIITAFMPTLAYALAAANSTEVLVSGAPFRIVTQAGLAAARASTAGMIGATTIGAVVAIVIFAVVTAVMQGMNVFEAAQIPDQLDAAIAAAGATPDLAQVVATDAGLREVFTVFVEGTMPDNPAPVAPFPAPVAPVPPAGPDDRRFFLPGPTVGGEYVGSVSYLDWDRTARSVRLNDGWFVINEDGVERLSLSLDFLGPDDTLWTASRVGEEFLVVPAGTTNDFRLAPETQPYVADHFTVTRPGGVQTRVELAPGNRAPSFTPGPNVIVDEDSGAYRASWAGNISAGEAGQQISFELGSTVPCPLCIGTSGQPAPTSPADHLFSQQPAIDSTGQLTFTLAPHANGVATVTVRARDDGGTTDGGGDTSDPQTFTITINPVGDPFVVPADASLSVSEDAARHVGYPDLGVYDPDRHPPATLAGLFHSYVEGEVLRQPQHGTVSVGLTLAGGLTYTPAAEFAGTDGFRYKACDGSGSCGEQEVTVVVAAVNDPPSFTGGGNIALTEDAGAYSGLWATNISAGPNESAPVGVGVEVTNNDNPGLFSHQPAVGGDGTLTFAPAPNANGTANVTVRAKELGFVIVTDQIPPVGSTPVTSNLLTSDPQTFTITVRPVNDASSFTPGPDVTVEEDAGAHRAPWATAISVGPANESTQTLEFEVANDNPNLFGEQPTVAANGTLSFAPAPNANGRATVTVAARDSGGTADGGQNLTEPRSLTITVNAVNDSPAVPASVPTVNVLEDTPMAVSLVGDLGVHDTADTEWTGAAPFPPVASLSMLEAPTLGTLTSDATSGILAFTPAPDASGGDGFGYEVCDRGAPDNACVVQRVNVAITPVNDAPSFTKGADQIVVLNSGARTVTNWATDISAGPSNESRQKLTVAVGNDNTALFSAQPALDANGTLSFTPAAGRVGSALVTVVLTDDGGTANGGRDATTQTFLITVRYNFGDFAKPVEVPPTINSVTAGSRVPIRWRLTDASGAPVTDLTSVTITAPLSTSQAGGAIQEMELSVDLSSGLKNLGNGNYQYNWEPPRSYAGSFRTMLLDLGEGPAVQHPALFQFR